MNKSDREITMITQALVMLALRDLVSREDLKERLKKAAFEAWYAAHGFGCEHSFEELL